jgi:hypothetical protein
MMKPRMMKCDCARQIRTNPVWTNQIWTKHISRMALAGALGLSALAGLAPQAARAQDTDKGLFGTMLKSLGIGGENQIEYRERPPLVVPPTRDLPPPQTSAAARDPNWPIDPKSGQPQKRGDQIRDLDKLAVPQRPVEPGVAAGRGARIYDLLTLRRPCSATDLASGLGHGWQSLQVPGLRAMLVLAKHLVGAIPLL